MSSLQASNASTFSLGDLMNPTPLGLLVAFVCIITILLIIMNLFKSGAKSSCSNKSTACGGRALSSTSVSSTTDFFKSFNPLSWLTKAVAPTPAPQPVVLASTSAAKSKFSNPDLTGYNNTTNKNLSILQSYENGEASPYSLWTVNSGVRM